MRQNSRTVLQPSPSSRALAKLISTRRDWWFNRFEQSGLHRTMVYRYARGGGKPNVQVAGLIHEVTRGRVSAATWRSDHPVSSSVGERIYT